MITETNNNNNNNSPNRPVIMRGYYRPGVEGDNDNNDNNDNAIGEESFLPSPTATTTTTTSPTISPKNSNISNINNRNDMSSSSSSSSLDPPIITKDKNNNNTHSNHGVVGGMGVVPTIPSTGLIRISLSKPMGIVFEPMMDIHNPTQQRGVRICELPPEGIAASTQRLQVEDELLSINDKTVSRLSFDQVMDILLDAPPQQVHLLFRRPKKLQQQQQQSILTNNVALNNTTTTTTTAATTTTNHTTTTIITPTTIKNTVQHEEKKEVMSNNKNTSLPSVPTISTSVVPPQSKPTSTISKASMIIPTHPLTIINTGIDAPKKTSTRRSNSNYNNNNHPKYKSQQQQHDILDEEESSVLTGDNTAEIMDQSTYDGSTTTTSYYNKKNKKRNNHIEEEEEMGTYAISANFLDHLIDSICSPILGDTGNPNGKSRHSSSSHYRKKSHTKYHSREDVEEEDEDDTTYQDDDETNYTEEDDDDDKDSLSKNKKYTEEGRRKKTTTLAVGGGGGGGKSRSRKQVMDEESDEESLPRNYPRGRSTSKSTTQRNIQSSSMSRKLPGKDSQDYSNHTRGDMYNNNKANKHISSVGKLETETIHESEEENMRGKSQEKYKTHLQKQSSTSSGDKMNKSSSLNHHVLPNNMKRSKSPRLSRQEILVTMPKNIISNIDKGVSKLKIETSHSLEDNNNIPIKELVYDDQLADVSVMDSLGGPSIVLDMQRRNNHHHSQESKKQSVARVRLETIVQHGKNYPYDLGYTREEFIQSNPLQFYRYVVGEILKKHEPEKLRLVSKLMEKYKDREEHLIEKLSNRYQSNHVEATTPKQKQQVQPQQSLNKDSLDDWDTKMPINRQVENHPSQPQQQQQQQQQLKVQQENDDGFQNFNAFPSVYFDSDSKDVFGFDPWKTTVEPSEEDAVPNDIEDVVYDDTNSSYYTESDYDSIDGTSPVVIAQVSDLINYVYGKTTVVGQIDRVSTIMKAYEGREAVLLELLETKALIKANSTIDPGSMDDLPTCIRDNPSFQKPQQQQEMKQEQVGGNLQSPVSNITMSTSSSPTNFAQGHSGAQQKVVSSIARSPNAGKNKSGLFGFLTGRKSKEGGSGAGGAFPTKAGQKKTTRSKHEDIRPTNSSDRSV